MVRFRYRLQRVLLEVEGLRTLAASAPLVAGAEEMLGELLGALRGQGAGSDAGL